MECWRSQDSMRDSSTTTAPILDLIAGDSWPEYQLRSRIKDILVVSKSMKLLTLVGVVFIGPLALQELHVRFLHNRTADPRSDCGRLLGSTPATQRYKVCPTVAMAHGAIGSQEERWLGWGRLGSGSECLLEQ